MTKYRRAAGWTLVTVVAVIMLFAAAGKLFGFAPERVMDQLESYGLADDVPIIAFAEIVSALLLLVPRTASLGTLMASSFWGGAIVAHLTGNDDFSAVTPAVLLVLTWAGSWLRHPAVLGSFSGKTNHPHAQ